jgi:hypothetical protein
MMLRREIPSLRETGLSRRMNPFEGAFVQSQSVDSSQKHEASLKGFLFGENMKKAKIIKISIEFICPFCKKDYFVAPSPLDFTGWSYEPVEEGGLYDSGVSVSFRCPGCKKISEANI